jgi:GTP cyclohydrolase I
MDLNAEKIGRLVHELLVEIGEDPAREGLREEFLSLIDRRAA